MWKTFILTLFLILFVVTPCYAITQSELNLINQEMDKIAIKTNNTPTDWSKWNNYDTALIALEIIDWGQTRDIADSYEKAHFSKTTSYENGFLVTYYSYFPGDYKYFEVNPLLGKHPSLKKVNEYFSLCILTDVLISNHSSSEFHKWWDIVGLTLESYCVTHNWKMGVGFKF
jgi:hypothetical protein